MDHRPTLGSRLLVWRDPIRNKQKCRCGEPWTARHKAEAGQTSTSEAGRPWQAGDGPVPDSPRRQPQPIDVIQTRDGFYQIRHDPFSEAERRGNRREGR